MLLYQAYICNYNRSLKNVFTLLSLLLKIFSNSWLIYRVYCTEQQLSIGGKRMLSLGGRRFYLKRKTRSLYTFILWEKTGIRVCLNGLFVTTYVFIRDRFVWIARKTTFDIENGQTALTVKCSNNNRIRSVHDWFDSIYEYIFLFVRTIIILVNTRTQHATSIL